MATPVVVHFADVLPPEVSELVLPSCVLPITAPSSGPTTRNPTLPSAISHWPCDKCTTGAPTAKVTPLTPSNGVLWSSATPAKKNPAATPSAEKVCHPYQRLGTDGWRTSEAIVCRSSEEERPCARAICETVSVVETAAKNNTPWMPPHITFLRPVSDTLARHPPRSCTTAAGGSFGLGSIRSRSPEVSLHMDSPGGRFRANRDRERRRRASNDAISVTIDNAAVVVAIDCPSGPVWSSCLNEQTSPVP